MQTLCCAGCEIFKEGVDGGITFVEGSGGWCSCARPDGKHRDTKGSEISFHATRDGR